MDVHRIAGHVLRGLAVSGALLVGSSTAGVTDNSYSTTLVVDGESFSGCSQFDADQVFNAQHLGADFLYGFYSELDLFLFGFWTLESSLPSGVPVFGSGGHVFFGLFMFGSFEPSIGDGSFSISGTISNCSFVADRSVASPLAALEHPFDGSESERPTFWCGRGR